MPGNSKHRRVGGCPLPRQNMGQGNYQGAYITACRLEKVYSYRIPGNLTLLFPWPSFREHSTIGWSL